MSTASHETEMKVITNPVISKKEDWTESDAQAGVDGGILFVGPVDTAVKYGNNLCAVGYVKEGADDGGSKEYERAIHKLGKTYSDEKDIPKEALEKVDKILHDVDETIGTNVGVVNGGFGGDGCSSAVYRTNNKDVYQVLYTGSLHGFPWETTEDKSDIEEEPDEEYTIPSSDRIWVGDPTYFQGEDEKGEKDENKDKNALALREQIKEIDGKSGMIVPTSFSNGHSGLGFICQFPKTGSIKVQEYVTNKSWARGIIAIVLLTWIPPKD